MPSLFVLVTSALSPLTTPYNHRLPVLLTASDESQSVGALDAVSAERYADRSCPSARPSLENQIIVRAGDN